MEMAQPAIDAGGHQLVISLPSERVELEGDLVRLAQVLGNLLINAAKYTPQAGRIELTAELLDGHARVRVSDTGIGIAPELLPRIFDFFVQGSRSLERSQGGLGIGLTLVKRITEMHGGSARALSAGPGQGSEFIVDWPLAPPRAAREKGSERGRLQAPVHRRRVLVVDDNVDAAESAATLLGAWGHEVHTVHDGTAALSAVREFRPDVVLLDIGLPGKNGYEVARELRAIPDSAVKLLAAMTGYGQEEDRRRSAEAGFDVHLTKPLDLEHLQKLLHDLSG
jgi:CheY-like chemotaxis protein